MIAVSDNTATNLVLDRVGLDAVNGTMRSLGTIGSVLDRRILCHLPVPVEPENWAAPRDFTLAIQAIVNGDAGGPESCAHVGDLRTTGGGPPHQPFPTGGTR